VDVRAVAPDERRRAFSPKCSSTNVIVPDSDRIGGDRRRAWRVALTCLSFERGRRRGRVEAADCFDIDRLIALAT